MRNNILTALFAAVMFSIALNAQETPRWLRHSALSPDGKTVAFCYQGDLFTVSAAGGQARQITSSPAYEADPVWGADGSLTTIVDNFIPESQQCGLPGNAQLVAGVDGALYFLGAVWNANVLQLYSVDQNAKTLKAYGAPIPVTITSSGSVSEGCAVAINPVTGMVVNIHGQKNTAPVIACLDESLQWSNFAGEWAVPSTTTMAAAFDKDGKGYIAYQTTDGIVLYGVGLEADVLPE